MDKKKLRQYRSLKREQKMLEEKMEKLNERAERIPAVIGKVKGSMDTFPYIETHMRIIMDEPKQADMIDRQMRINERRREQVEELLTEIEEFISLIPDSNARQIFELIYLNGKTQQEVGDQLGFLPGDLQSKVDPYLRPLYDALYQIMGAESFAANMEKGLIEVAPLAYMRGRTLDNAFIILDEAQNTTPAQMKMFLTRIGFGSKVIVTGDSSQKDLPAGTVSGLDVAIKVLSKVDDIGFVKLTNQDVVRHPLVQKIVKAYEDYESRQNRRTKSLVKDKESENKKENTTKRRGR